MSLEEKHGAVLIAIHDDLLPSEAAIGATVDVSETIAPTRTTAGSEYRLAADVCVIGRDRACQVRVREHRTDISRKHATIKREGQVYILYDHSLHGTFVNGLKIDGLCRLDTDDVIGLANSKEMVRFINYDQARLASIVLTDREHEVLRLLAAGRSIKQIADDLVISQNTVNSHLKNLYDKLDANSRSTAVSQARKLRLLEE